MARQYNIRWQQSDHEELKRAVKNFNAKVSRLEKKYPENKSALPQKITVTQMKELIKTRNDFKREINSLKRFSKRGAEDLVVVPGNDYKLKVTKWQKKEMTMRAGLINRKRKQRLKEISEIEMTDRGESLGYTRGDFGMGKADEVALSPINSFTPKMNRRDLEFKFEKLKQETTDAYWDERDLMMKENYIKALQNNFNPNDVADIVEEIREMDYKDFRKIYEAEGGNFEVAYPEDSRQYSKYLTALKTIWTPRK